MTSNPVQSIVPKTAHNRATAHRPTFFYESARDGMRDFLAHNLSSPDEGVLLPAFIGLSPREGSGVFDPVLSVGARPGFYGLHPDLTVDLEHLRRKLGAESYRVIVLIHYFGRTEPQLAAMRAVADQAGALLVEDLAHGFFTAQSDGQAGHHGDLNLFSLHKMFPFEDGGMIQYADSGLVRGQIQSRPELAQRVLDYDWAQIARVRRENFRILSERLIDLPEYGREFELLWEFLGEHDVPQTLPIRILSDRRDAIYSGMNADGYGMVSLYHTLIEPVRVGFRMLNQLSRQIINFPVHQDVKVSDLDGMLASFGRHLMADTATASRREGRPS